ncbi:hypothetical protein WDV06_05895 [Streptomyces racemochromogenes]|uniref:Uncharacterized protein n=1 Tax=Streptomyces racemochromogenes TaxID=67353 RepID=A0ABW7P9B4_9ACTN
MLPGTDNAVYEACQAEDIRFCTLVPVACRRAEVERLGGEEPPAQRAACVSAAASV